MLKRRLILASATLALLSPSPASAWGPAARQAALTKALDTLPGPLKSFYRAHRLELPTLSPDAEPAVDDSLPERRFTIDRLVPYPFLDLPRTEKALKERFGDEAEKIGRIPWLVQEHYLKLVEAFKSGDKSRILNESDSLGLLIIDIKNPLALTDNSDGQKTGQHGLWTRIGTKLPEAMEKRLKLSAEAARYLDDPKEFVFGMMLASYVWIDNIVYQEALAKRGKPGYTEIYYEALELRCGEIVRDRLGEAAADVGSYWYTAWTAAGKPDLK